MFRVLLTLSFFLTGEVIAMCDFPHNPSAYCLKYELSGKPKKIKKYSPFSCEYNLKKINFRRPPNTYHFDSNLEKVKHNKFSSVEFKNSKRIKEPKKLLAKSCDLKEKGNLVVFLSCYDTYENIPDFRFLTNGKPKDQVFDPWVQKNINFDCSN